MLRQGRQTEGIKRTRLTPQGSCYSPSFFSDLRKIIVADKCPVFFCRSPSFNTYLPTANMHPPPPRLVWRQTSTTPVEQPWFKKKNGQLVTDVFPLNRCSNEKSLPLVQNSLNYSVNSNTKYTIPGIIAVTINNCYYSTWYIRYLSFTLSSVVVPSESCCCCRYRGGLYCSVMTEIRTLSFFIDRSSG